MDDSDKSEWLNSFKYLNKTYLKTASLIANSCEAIAILNNSDPVQIEAARDFGKHIGLAFQIQDDRLDFIADAEQLGKVRLRDSRSLEDLIRKYKM